MSKILKPPKIINPLWIIFLFFSFTEITLGYVVFNTDIGNEINRALKSTKEINSRAHMLSTTAKIEANRTGDIGRNFLIVSNSIVRPIMRLRDAANARKAGRTSKTHQGAKRRTITESVLESLRVYLPSFTLSGILAEIQRWSDNGRSCFTELSEKLKLPLPETSIVDALFPPPTHS